MRRLRDTFTRSIAWTAGRILTALALAAALAYFGMGDAKAFDPPGASSCTSSACYYNDQGFAYKGCMATAKAAEAAWNGSRGYINGHCVASGSDNFICNIYVQFSQGQTPGGLSPCGTARGVAYNSNHRYPVGATCAARANLVSLSQTNFSSPTLCNFGCQYDQTTPQSDTTITDSNNNSLRFGIRLGGKANGSVCVNPDGSDKPKEKGEEPPPCLVIGTDSAGDIKHCPQEDGSSCTVSGRGTKFCQPPPPGTQGPKVDTGRQDGNSQSASQGTPPQAPAPRPGEAWVPGPGSTVCNNITGTCSESNTYVNSGTANVNGTPITGDGSGPTGTGQQDSGSSGTGTGTGSGTGTDMGPTNGLLGDIKGILNSSGTPDATFEGQVEGAFSGENDVPDNDEHADPTDGIKQVRDGNWLTDQLDDAGFLGGGQCPADIQVNVGTTSIPLTFGPICQLLSAISGLVMAASYLIAFRIMTA